MSTQTIADKVQTSASLDTEEVQQFQNILDRAMQSAAELDKLFNRGQGNGAVHDLRVYAGGFLARVSGDDPEVVNTDYTGNFMVLTGIDVGGTLYSVGGMLNGVLQWGASYLDGTLLFGGGTFVGDENGLTVANAAFIGFKDSTGTRRGFMGMDPSDYMNFQNNSTAKGFIFFIKNTDASTPSLQWREDPSNANVAQVLVGPGTGGNVFNVGNGITMWGGKDGTETVFNNDSKNIDFRIEGDTDANNFFLDASADRVGIGTSAPSEKLHVNGNGLFSGSISASNISGSSSGSNSGDVTLAGSPNYITIAGQVITRSLINLTSHVTGTLPVANGGTGITSLGTGIATWLGAPSSANLLAAITDETGTGSLVFSVSPTFTGTVMGTNLSLSGSIELKPPVTVGAATYNQLAADSYIIANRAGTITITLLTASSFAGHRLVIKTITANIVVSASSNVVPRAGGAAGTAILAATAGNWVELVSDGTNWVIMAGN